jgi:hypothetical protein
MCVGRVARAESTMSTETKASPVRDEHFRAFGAIINMFARFEWLMVMIMTKITGTDIAHLSMMTAELPYRGKRDTTLALLKLGTLPPENVERVIGFLGELHKWNKLRNSIAHSAWKEGARPRSIKPLGLSVRGGTVTATGLDPDERDYTDVELLDIADELISLHTRFQEYLYSVDLLPKSTDKD